MILTFRDLGRMILRSLFDPAAVARILIDWRLPRDVLWMALGLVTVLSVLLVALTQGPAPELPAGSQPVIVSPFAYAAILGASLVLLVFALQVIGQMLGGTGDLGAALALVIWLEVVALALRVAQAAASLLLPPLAGPISFVGMGVLLWCLMAFTNILHGFDSFGKSILTIVLAAVGIGLGLGLILSLIGFGTAAMPSGGAI